MKTLAEKLRAHLEAADSGVPNTLVVYADNPVGFAREVLGIDPWSRQIEVLDAVAQHNRVAVRSGQKVGKSTTMSALALWWVATRHRARVVFTAPSSRQVRQILWHELRRLHRGARIQLGGELFEMPERGLQFPDGREVVGFSTNEPERMAGISGPELMFLVDEASGVDEVIFEAVKGNLVGGGRLVLTGNPTRTSGTFFEAFGAKGALWHQLHISSLESPNVTGEAAIPGLARAEDIAEMGADFGEESAAYSVRVLGNFPLQGDDVVITLALVDAARESWDAIMRDGGRTFQTLGALECGVDVARFGDDESVIVCRRGNVALPPITMRGADVMAVAQRVRQVVAEHSTANERAIVRVDTVGVGGGVADALRQDGSLTVVDVNASAAPTNATKFQRTREELWFTLRDWLKAGGALPPDRKLEGELVAPRFSYSPSGKLIVEPKDETKKRLRRSPDRADALALAVYAPPDDDQVYWKALEVLAKQVGGYNVWRRY